MRFCHAPRTKCLLLADQSLSQLDINLQAHRRPRKYRAATTLLSNCRTAPNPQSTAHSDREFLRRAPAPGRRQISHHAHAGPQPIHRRAPGVEIPVRSAPSASGAHNPLHVDFDFGRTSGVVTDWAPQTALRRFHTRFMAMTKIGNQIPCTAKITKKAPVAKERRVRLAFTSRC